MRSFFIDNALIVEFIVLPVIINSTSSGKQE